MYRYSMIFIIVLCLTACSNFETETAIQVESEMTIARSDLFPVNGKKEFVSLRLIRGNYSEDWTPGAYMGRSWKGDFRLSVLDEQGVEISYLDLNNHFEEELMFNNFFEFQFDDYNGDQMIDFLVGQYGTSNGNFYKMFTLTHQNQIQELHIADDNELFISGGNRYSTKLEKVDNQSFIASYYNNDVGQYIEVTYTWDGSRFVTNLIED